MAAPTQRAQPKALDRPLLRDPAGAATASVAGADAGACRVLQLRCARGAQPRGAGERGVLRRTQAPLSSGFACGPSPCSRRAEERGPGEDRGGGLVRRWRRAGGEVIEARGLGGGDPGGGGNGAHAAGRGPRERAGRSQYNFK